MPSADIRTGSALSGLLLVLFIVVHLLGLIPAVVAPEQFEAYATVLHASPWLPLVEITLLLVALVHIGLSLSKAIANRQAGNSASSVSAATSCMARSLNAARLHWPHSPAEAPWLQACSPWCFWPCTWGSCAGPVRPAARKRPC